MAVPIGDDGSDPSEMCLKRTGIGRRLDIVEYDVCDTALYAQFCDYSTQSVDEIGGLEPAQVDPSPGFG